MIKHIILWTLKEEFTESQKAEIKKNAKRELEALVGEVPGLLELKVQISYLPSSNVELMLNSTLENEAALKAYADHPKHVAVANTFVRPYTATRSCIDYEIEA